MFLSHRNNEWSQLSTSNPPRVIHFSYSDQMWITPCELYYGINTVAGFLASKRPGSQSGSNLPLELPPWRTVRITKRHSRKQWRKTLPRQSVPNTNPKRVMVCARELWTDVSMWTHIHIWQCTAVCISPWQVMHSPISWSEGDGLLHAHEGACMWIRTVIYGFSVCTPLWPICVVHAHVTW